MDFIIIIIIFLQLFLYFYYFADSSGIKNAIVYYLS